MTYGEPSQTSKIELYGKIVDWIQLLTVFAERSMLGVSQGYEYVWCVVICSIYLKYIRYKLLLLYSYNEDKINLLVLFKSRNWRQN